MFYFQSPILRYSSAIVLMAGLLSCSGGAKQETAETSAAIPDSAKTEAPNPVPENSGPILGIDVSHYQGEINWSEIKTDGITFAYAKATGGLGSDERFAENWAGMKTAGVVRGAYHFFYFDDDPTEQAENFIKHVGSLESGDLPPVLDLEEGGVNGQVDKAEYVKKVFTWLDKVESELKMKPMIYTDPNFSGEYLTDAKFGDYLLWIAEYGAEAHVPSAWQGKGWTFWQYSATGGYKGLSGETDHDKFKGSMEELKALLKP